MHATAMEELYEHMNDLRGNTSKREFSTNYLGASANYMTSMKNMEGMQVLKQLHISSLCWKQRLLLAK